MNTISKLTDKLRDAGYRKAFVASQINIGIPFQIRALLKKRGKKQDWLAAKTGMLQPRISGLMTAGKTHPNIETLRRLAEAFDCGLAVRFVPFSELARWSDEFDPESFDVPEFAEDLGFLEKKSPGVAGVNSPVFIGSTELSHYQTDNAPTTAPSKVIMFPAGQHDHSSPRYASIS